MPYGEPGGLLANIPAPPEDTGDDQDPMPTTSPGLGRQWVPDGYGGWTSETMPEWLVRGDGDGTSAAAALRGQDLQYQLGLKGIDVDWAKVGLDKQRIAIEQAAQRTNQGGLMESIRSNKATEAARARQRALDAASSAVTAYLEGTRLADARRLSAFQESRQLLPYLVDPNQKYQAGLAPGGALQQAQERFGLAPSTLGLQKKTLDPRYALEGAPGPRNVGPDVMKYITAVQGAGK